MKLNRCKKLLKSDSAPVKADDNDVSGADIKSKLIEVYINLKVIGLKWILAK